MNEPGLPDKLHDELQTALVAPALSADFDARVFAQIAANDAVAKSEAKVRAQREFRRRMAAFAIDWRELTCRHAGSVLACAAALVAVWVALRPLLMPYLTNINALLTTSLPDAMRLSSSWVPGTLLFAVFGSGAAFLWLRAQLR